MAWEGQPCMEWVALVTGAASPSPGWMQEHGSWVSHGAPLHPYFWVSAACLHGHSSSVGGWEGSCPVPQESQTAGHQACMEPLRRVPVEVCKEISVPAPSLTSGSTAAVLMRGRPDALFLVRLPSPALRPPGRLSRVTGLRPQAWAVGACPGVEKVLSAAPGGMEIGLPMEKPIITQNGCSHQGGACPTLARRGEGHQGLRAALPTLQASVVWFLQKHQGHLADN